MDEKKLNEIEARANAATPGPWETEHVRVHGVDYGCTGVKTVHEDGVQIGRGAYTDTVCQTNHGTRTYEPQPIADMQFIAASRTDVPTLTAEIRRMWKMERIRLECNNRDLERRREAEHTAELLRKENGALKKHIVRNLKAAQAATEGE